MVRPSILIVDDSAVIRHTVRKSLLQRFPHFALEVAGNGHEAQQLIERTPFHLVLCDWEMPKMCGDELLAWLRSHSDHGRLPFVMVTSRTEPKWLHQAARLGVSNYLAKPFSPRRIAELAAFELLRSGLPETALTPPQNTAAMAAPAPAGQTMPPAAPRPPAKRMIPSGIWDFNLAKLRAAASDNERRPLRRLMVAEIRAHEKRVRGLLELLGTRTASVTLPDGEVPPLLCEQVVFDVDSPADQARVHLNACVTHIGWYESRAGVRRRCVDLVFVDEDDNKLAQVRELMRQVCQTPTTPPQDTGRACA